MSYFACISFDKKEKKQFQQLLQQTARHSIIGKLCRGNKTGFISYFITTFYHAGTKKIPQNEIETFLTTVSNFNNNVISFNIILHWFEGDIYEENVTIKREQKITLNDFEKIFPDLERDVKYKIVLDNYS